MLDKKLIERDYEKHIFIDVQALNEDYDILTEASTETQLKWISSIGSKDISMNKKHIEQIIYDLGFRRAKNNSRWWIINSEKAIVVGWVTSKEEFKWYSYNYSTLSKNNTIRNNVYTMLTTDTFPKQVFQQADNKGVGIWSGLTDLLRMFSV